MNILEIYKEYQIMPQLQEHQLKVAGVGSLICNNLHPSLALPLKGRELEESIQGRENRDDALSPTLSPREREEVVATCLLHDMGNIIKFDLSFTDRLHPGRFDPVSLKFWQDVRNQFISKFGKDEHTASVEICKEIGVKTRVVKLVDAISFLGARSIAQGSDFGKKICQYADDRVGPKGVVSLYGRFSDLRVRYQHHKDNTKERDDFESSLREIEKQIFAHCKIKPEDITEEAVEPEIEKLRNFEISVDNQN